MNRSAVFAAMVCCTFVQSAAAGPPVTLRTLFQKMAPVEVEHAGLVRLPLPAEVLETCEPGFSDLRLLNPEGIEIPFVVDPGSGPAERVERFRPELVDVRREREEQEDRLDRMTETYIVTAPPPREGPWTLHVTASAPSFERRLRVEAFGEAEPTPLLDDLPTFRIRAEGEVAERIAFELPRFESSQLRLVLSGEGEAFLTPSFSFERRDRVGVGRKLVVPFPILRTEEGDEETMIDLRRRRGVIPLALSLRTTSTWFDRRVTVTDGIDGPLLASGRVYRLQTGGERLEIRLERRPRRNLRVAIHDGDSPPLQDLRLEAILEQPSIVFAAAGQGGTAKLYFGGARAHRPHYDVANLLPQREVVEGVRVFEGEKILELTGPATGVLGPIVDNPDFDSSPALAFTMRPGAEVDPRRYTHRRRLQVSSSPEGVSRVAFSPAEAGHALATLADVRVVGENARQWPWIRATKDTSVAVPLEITLLPREGTTSVYELVLPAPEVSLGTIELETDATFLDRPWRLKAGFVDGADPRLLRDGRLRRRARSHGPLRLGFPEVRVRRLVLEIDDGSEAPIVWNGARGWVRLPQIFVTAPGGEYSLLLGDDAAIAPSYELEAVRNVVLAVESELVPAAPLEPNPAFRATAKLMTGQVLQRVLFAAVLILAVAVLGFMTFRMVSREPE